MIEYKAWTQHISKTKKAFGLIYLSWDFNVQSRDIILTQYSVKTIIVTENDLHFTMWISMNCNNLTKHFCL
jgi:hypothetical protein